LRLDALHQLRAECAGMHFNLGAAGHEQADPAHLLILAAQLRVLGHQALELRLVGESDLPVQVLIEPSFCLGSIHAMFTFCLTRSRARLIRDFTVPMEMPRISATSS